MSKNAASGSSTERGALDDRTTRGPLWVGTLGERAVDRNVLAASLLSAAGEASTLFVAVSTEVVDSRVERGAASCQLDAAVVLVPASDRLSDESTRLLHALGRYDVPVVIAVTRSEHTEDLAAVLGSVRAASEKALGYRAEIVEFADDGPDALKRLVRTVEGLAAKRERRGALSPSPKDYPFVVAQDQLDQLMRHNVRAALKAHQQQDNSVFVWRDGQLIELAPSEIFT